VRQEIEAIYQQYRQGLYTLALAVTRRGELAEDAIQEAFARLWKFKAPPPGDKVAYVFAAVRNAAIDQLRRQRHRDRQPQSIYDGHEGPLADAQTSERRDMVRLAVDALGEQQREVVVMKIYGGLTFEQIAKTLDEPLATVASRYRRAMEAIKVQLEGKI
jgi:RNA polymerase sigma-70 factor (ECF subfamily)